MAGTRRQLSKLLAGLLVGVSVAATGLALPSSDDPSAERLKYATETYQRATTLAEQGHLADAVAQYREALSQEPEEAYWHPALAQALQRQGDQAGALDEFRQAAAICPDDPVLHSAYQEALDAHPAPAAHSPGSRRTALDEEFAAGQDELSLPVAYYKPQPEYSERAREANYQGTVTLGLVVDEKGRISNIRVLRPLGLGLDESAVAGVQQWKFRPGARRRAPAPVLLIVKFTFRLTM